MKPDVADPTKTDAPTNRQLIGETDAKQQYGDGEVRGLLVASLPTSLGKLVRCRLPSFLDHGGE